MKRYWKVAVLANIKDDNEELPTGVPPDAFADYDSIETIRAIREAIESWIALELTVVIGSTGTDAKNPGGRATGRFAF